jgi:NAD(P)-dependent dehydrogenase (short-subunit alcohol dehydrogenase family)
MSHLHDQNNPVALITGASKGLGHTLANFLAAQGYHLIITARGAEALHNVSRDFMKYGNQVIVQVGDVNDEAHRQQLAESVGNFGRLDLLINNASTLGQLPMTALLSYTPEALRDVFDINLIAPLTLVQAVLPHLKSSSGLVVNISSDAAIGGYEGWGIYGASKAALDLISLTLANELRSDNISVVSVDPGDMQTDMHQDAFPDEDISDRPLPEVTLPFWAWLFGQDRLAIAGQRFQAQSELWEVKS